MKKLMMMALLMCGIVANAAEKKDSLDNSPWGVHLYVGWNAATNVPTGLSFAPFKSWNIDLTLLQYDYTPKGASQTYSVGLGLGWRNYTLRDKNMQRFVVDPTSKVITPGTFEVGQEDRWSNIHTLSLSMPLLFRQQIGKHVGISVGAMLNYNVYGRVRNSYEVGDVEYDIKTKGIKYRPFTVDPMVIFDADDFAGLYLRYSPMSVLKSEYGPDFKSISFGLYF